MSAAIIGYIKMSTAEKYNQFYKRILEEEEPFKAFHNTMQILVSGLQTQPTVGVACTEVPPYTKLFEQFTRSCIELESLTTHLQAAQGALEQVQKIDKTAEKVINTVNRKMEAAQKLNQSMHGLYEKTKGLVASYETILKERNGASTTTVVIHEDDYEVIDSDGDSGNIHPISKSLPFATPHLVLPLTITQKPPSSSSSSSSSSASSSYSPSTSSESSSSDGFPPVHSATNSDIGSPAATLLHNRDTGEESEEEGEVTDLDVTVIALNSSSGSSASSTLTVSSFPVQRPIPPSRSCGGLGWLLSCGSREKSRSSSAPNLGAT